VVIVILLTAAEHSYITNSDSSNDNELKNIISINIKNHGYAVTISSIDDDARHCHRAQLLKESASVESHIKILQQ
jgi:hypothetical protein